MQAFPVLYIAPPIPFGGGIRLWWAYEGRVRDIVAPNLAAAREIIADALARLRNVPEEIHEPERTAPTSTRRA